MRGLTIGVGVHWVWRGQSQLPLGKERGKGCSGLGAYGGWTWVWAKGLDTKAPKSQRPLPSPARPGEKITVIDDSNEEWWRVREMTEERVGHGLSLKG